ncbi:hypothetical protein CASFOL_015757 [Castilleja foliolosa]|uniref:Putative plant transposon protein domain-containing protein n=1 Tax=Castilleja foliolosa TaxID=1961234 RepID=A0ABD3DI48_9LAMI
MGKIATNQGHQLACRSPTLTAGTPVATEESVITNNLAIVVYKAPPSAAVSPPAAVTEETLIPAKVYPAAAVNVVEIPTTASGIPEVSAPTSPEIPNTDFFSEENIGASIPAVSEPIIPTNMHASIDSESEDCTDEETLADMLESLKSLKKSPKTSVPLPVGSNAVNIVDNDSDYLPSSRSTSEDISTTAADQDLMTTEASPPSSDDLHRVIDEIAEEEEKDEDDVNVTDLVAYSSKFLTVGSEASFKDLQSRSMICEKRLMVDVFEKFNLVEFFRARGVYATVTTAVPFVREIVLEFYANLLPQVCKVNSVSYGKVFVRGKFYTFTPEKINLLMGTENCQGTSTVVNMDDAISLLTHGKITKWKEQLPAAKLTSFFSVLHKIAVFNWIPSKNSTVITRPQAQLLYRLGTGMKFNFGQMVFDLVTKFAQSTVVSSLLFPSLIFNLLETQGCAVLEGDVLTAEAEFFTIRTHLLKGDRVVDLPWVDRRNNVIEENVGTSANNIDSNICHLSRSTVENHIVRLEAQLKDLQLMIDALRGSLLPSGQGGEAARAEDEVQGSTDDAANINADEETESDDETLHAAFARARKGKGVAKETVKDSARKRIVEEETSPRRSQRRRRS